MTPILVPDGVFERDHVLELFEQESQVIDPKIVGIVVQTIKQYPQGEKTG
jgi:hypothetical protein